MRTRLALKVLRKAAKRRYRTSTITRACQAVLGSALGRQIAMERPQQNIGLALMCIAPLIVPFAREGWLDLAS